MELLEEAAERTVTCEDRFLRAGDDSLLGTTTPSVGGAVVASSAGRRADRDVTMGSGAGGVASFFLAGDRFVGDFLEGDLRPGDLRPGDLRPGDLRPGDLRPGDLRLGEALPRLLERPLRLNGACKPIRRG